jgi:hypothetical protein
MSIIVNLNIITLPKKWRNVPGIMKINDDNTKSLQIIKIIALLF